ncbi:MAG: polysaccharide pyruvyl transferase CsaB [Oscillospiraceae bacterium]|nr:polysaccharide pyruvyl transferase CsaB [Oscillospiraceae bacterium]
MALKILLVTMGLEIGGAETHIVELAKALKARGNDVAIASNGGVYVPEITAVGIRHYNVPMHRRSIGPMVRSCFLLNRIIRAEAPDVVHAHARIPGFLCGLLKKRLHFPFVTTAHWVFDVQGLVRYLTNWGDKTVSVSEDIRTYLMENYGVDEKNIFITINGIDTEKFSPAISGERVRREFDIPDGAPVAVHVSRLDESRALAAQELVAAAPELCRCTEGLILLIAGSGDCFPALQAQAEAVNRSIGRRAVILAGARTDIPEVVAAGDVFVGVSRAALEAMSAAKPTLIAGNEGYLGVYTPDKLERAVESNFCCRGCPAITRETLCADLTRLLALPPEEKRALGADCRRAVLERYSIGRMTDDMLAAYRAALEPKRFLISGYYGYDNVGDEAILESLCGMIRKIYPAAGIEVLSHRPADTQARYDCDAVTRFSPLGLFSAVGRCDVLISGGGSLLQDTTSTRSLLYYLMVIRIAQRRHRRVVLLANGIGPVKKPANRRRVAAAVQNARYVTLRDPESLQEIAAMGVHRTDVAVSADPVFLMEPAETERAKKILTIFGIGSDPFVAVSVRPWKDSDGMEERLAEICDRIIEEHGRKVLFVTMQQGRDEQTAKEILTRMRNSAAVLEGVESARDIMAVIGQSDLILSMRLHSLIFAARMAVPAIGISYDPKLDAYLRLLEQPSAGRAADIDIAGTMAAVADILQNHAEKVKNLEEKRRDLVAAARQNEALLYRLGGMEREGAQGT